MSSEIIGQLLLHLLPSIVVLVLAFVAAADKSTRERWADLMYQAGAVRPEQRADPKVQGGVRVPFFVVAAALLLWPIFFFIHATRVIEVSPDAYGKGSGHFSAYGKGGAANGATATNAAGAPVGAAPGAAPGATAPAAPAVAPTFSPYGVPHTQ